MEPRVSFARTPDGVAIAYATLGEGLPLIHMRPLPWRHIQLEWRLPDVRWWYERLASGRRVPVDAGQVEGAGAGDVGFEIDGFHTPHTREAGAPDVRQPSPSAEHVHMAEPRASATTAK